MFRPWSPSAGYSHLLMLKDRREMNVGVHTTQEKVDLGGCGSSEDASHRTTPKPKNLMSAGRLTRKAVRGRNKGQATRRAGSPLCSVPHYSL